MFTSEKLAKLCHETARFLLCGSAISYDALESVAQASARTTVQTIIGGCHDPVELLGRESKHSECPPSLEACKVYIAVVRAYLATTKSRDTGGAQ